MTLLAAVFRSSLKDEERIAREATRQAESRMKEEVELARSERVVATKKLDEIRTALRVPWRDHEEVVARAELVARVSQREVLQRASDIAQEFERIAKNLRSTVAELERPQTGAITEEVAA